MKTGLAMIRPDTPSEVHPSPNERHSTAASAPTRFSQARRRFHCRLDAGALVIPVDGGFGMLFASGVGVEFARTWEYWVREGLKAWSQGAV